MSDQVFPSIGPDELVAASVKETVFDATPVRRCWCCGMFKEEAAFPARGLQCRACIYSKTRERLHREDERDQKVPVGPFARWLARRMGLLVGDRIRENWREALRLSDRNLREWAVHFDVDRESLSRWLAGTHYTGVRLSTVDRVLQRDGTTMLAELYPELYVFPESDDDDLRAAA